MSDNTEIIQTNDEKSETDSSPSLFNNVNTSTPTRLFGQFKPNGSGFSNFRQLSSNGENSSSTAAATSLFTSTLSKLSATNGSGGFGSSSTSLAASLAPLSSNKTLFGGMSSSTRTEEEEEEQEQEKDEEEKDNDGDDENEEDEETNKTAPSLFETAAKYEAERASTHPTANIQGDTSTGEEHEITKFQMAGKLYVYSPEQQTYIERGVGILKINESHDPSDWNKLQARLIMRLDKAFRVILNSPIFPKMTVERATDRSVRFGAQDESHLRIFIIKALANDCTNLCKELQSRIQIIERQHIESPVKNDSSSSSATTTTTTEHSAIRIRKRSHSKSDSDTSDTANDISKKSKLHEDCLNESKDSTSDEDSTESTKTGEQATTD